MSTLTIIGVGPGDPSLLTLSAVKQIQESNVVSFPVSSPGDKSMAEEIASQWITKDKKRLPLYFPMVTDAEILKVAWREASNLIAAYLSKEEDVVFLCAGDASLFATGSYLLLDFKSRHPKFPVNIIPGINSISAAAAVGHFPLCLQKEQLLILPTPDEPNSLRALLEDAERQRRIVALVKLGHRWSWVRNILQEMGILENSLFAQRIGWPDEEVVSAINIDENSKPYFSLLIIRQALPEIFF